MYQLSLIPSPLGVKRVVIIPLKTGAITVSVIASELLHPFRSVTVSTYVTVPAGVATGVKTLLLSSPVDGLHRGTPLPLPASVTDCPGAIAVSFPADTAGGASTVMAEKEEVSAGHAPF